MSDVSRTAIDICRPPDWRYRRARRLCLGNLPASPLHDDSRIRQLHRYLGLRRDATGPGDLIRLRSRSSALAAALEFKEGRLGIAPLLEAHLLAAAPMQLITERFGLSAAAIGAFHDLCFDVADRLVHRDIILRVVIFGGDAPQSRLRAVEQAIKLVGFLRGAAALEELLSPPLSAKGDLAGCAAALADSNDALADVMRYAALLSQSASADALSRHMLMQSVRRRAAEQPPPPLDEYQQSIRKMLDSLKILRGPPNPGDVPSSLEPFMFSAFELNAAEEFHLANGGDLPYAEKLLAAEPPPGWEPEVGRGAPDA